MSISLSRMLDFMSLAHADAGSPAVDLPTLVEKAGLSVGAVLWTLYAFVCFKLSCSGFASEVCHGGECSVWLTRTSPGDV